MGLLRVKAVRRDHDGAAGGKARHGLADEPLGRALLRRAAAQVVAAGIAEDMVHGLLLADAPGLFPDHDDQLRLIVVAVLPRRQRDLRPVRRQRVGEFAEEHDGFGDGQPRAQRVLAVVEADADDLVRPLHDVGVGRLFHHRGRRVGRQRLQRRAVRAGDHVLHPQAGRRGVDHAAPGDKAEMRFLETAEDVLVEDNQIHFNELQQKIKEALASLPDTYREAFILHRFGNKSYKGIAEMLQVSPKTVDYRIQQALKQLRILLKDYSPILLWLIGGTTLS